MSNTRGFSPCGGNDKVTAPLGEEKKYGSGFRTQLDLSDVSADGPGRLF